MHRESEELDFPTTGRLSRFTLRARNVIVHARTVAEQRGSNQVRNEHIVLGLLSEPDGLAAKAIVALGVSPDEVRRAMEAAIGSSRKRPRGRVGFSSASKKTLELALRAALNMMHNYIGTEHLLLGVLDNEGENAAKLLRELGVSREAAADWLIAELAAIQAARGA